MLQSGMTIDVNGQDFLVVEVYTKEWLQARTSLGLWNDAIEYGALLRDREQYHWRGLVCNGQMDLKPMGIKYYPPPAPTEEQLRSFKERMQKLAKKRKEENEQLKEDGAYQSRASEKDVVRRDDLGLPAKAPKRAKKGKLGPKIRVKKTSA
jgi:hypothetical protein